MDITTNTEANAAGILVTTVTCADHGIVDRKGRTVGGYVKVWRSATEGVYFAKSYATRNGVQFGAAFPKSTRAGADLTSAIEHAKRKLADQAKRYAKLSAAGKL